ncbi:MAG: M28 family peptidase [Chitinophagaceae bacterium]|nr:MAG: M28 family peptidase [Chitinophagaceae bacterium]
MVGFLLALGLSSFGVAAEAPRPALGNLKLFEKAGVKVIRAERNMNLGFALLSEDAEKKIQALSHAGGKCGGYELLPEEPSPTAAINLGESALKKLAERAERDQAARRFSPRENLLVKRPRLVSGLAELKEENLRESVRWLSAYPSRYSKQNEPNAHVGALATRLRAMLSAYGHPFSIEELAHRSTKQRSLRVHLEGAKRPQEIVVLGGHLDSLTSSWMDKTSPGADDNASGSANLIEALRVLSGMGQPERSVEFFWYAGEETGLLGSSEIAKEYKQKGRDVVGVLQLDMTLYPGAGEFVIGNVSDFTSPWLQQYLLNINDTYIHAKVIPDECGYACSDHASWYRQGYPTLMPFEADTERMNPHVHSAEDAINEDSNFAHSLNFAKIALVFAADLGNSEARAPK